MVESLLKVLEVGLSLWEHKEKHKYQDKYLKLKREYYEESNKPRGDRDGAILDNIEFELRLLADSFYLTFAGKQNA